MSDGARPARSTRRHAPRRRKNRTFDGALAVIDRLLVALVPISLNGESRRVEALHAIVTQLVAKAISGDTRAYRALLKYQEFASVHGAKKLELTFVENEYTRALAHQAGGGNV